MRSQLRIKLVGLVVGLFVIVVRCMGGSGYALGARVVNGDGELCILEFGTKTFGQVGHICVSSVAFGER